MITIISGTNRKGSVSLRIAQFYLAFLQQQGADVALLSLENQQVWERGESMLVLEAKYLLPADKFIFIMPEYNASFPGILKVMMDNSDIKKCWWYKKALLIGLSDGRAANIRGIEHMTSILHYLKVNVHYNKLLLSKVSEEIDKEGHVLKPATAALMEQQASEFIAF